MLLAFSVTDPTNSKDLGMSFENILSVSDRWIVCNASKWLRIVCAGLVGMAGCHGDMVEATDSSKRAQAICPGPGPPALPRHSDLGV